jgi:NADH-quinone oxidoreductase subunit L
MLEFLYRYFSLQSVIWCVVLFPLAAAAFSGCASVADRVRGRESSSGVVKFLCFFTGLFTFLMCVALLFTLTGFEGGEPSAITGPFFRWLSSGSINVEVGLKVDELSLVMIVVVSLVGFLSNMHAAGNSAKREGVASDFFCMNLFLSAMLFSLLADNMVMFLIGWDLALVSAALLVARQQRAAHLTGTASRFVAIGIAGSAFILVAMFLIYGVMAAGDVSVASGMFNFETMGRNAAYFVPLSTAISTLILIGVILKSAQFPFHSWLSDCGACQVPGSALIFGSSLITAGIYLMVRLGFVFAMSSWAMHLSAWAGVSSAILVAMLASVERDPRRIAAYLAGAQVGYMLLAIGVGAFQSASLSMVAFSLFMPLLFFSTECAINSSGGIEDIWFFGGLKRRMPITAWGFVIAAAALAGIFPFVGFFSRDFMFWQVYSRDGGFIWSVAFLSAGIVAFAAFRAAGAIFFGETNISFDKYKRISESGISSVLPMMILSTACIVGGAMAVPEEMGGTNIFSRWLSGLIVDELSKAPRDVSSGTHVVLMVVTVIWSLHFAILGWIIYAQKRDWPARIALRMGLFYKFISMRFYCSEVFSLIVRPISWFVKNVITDVIGDKFIEGLLMAGLSRMIGGLSAVVCFAGGGSMQRYFMYALIGIVVLVLIMVL